MIRTPNRGVVVAGAALGSVGIAVGVLGASAAEAAPRPADAAHASATSTAAGGAATTEEIAAERRSLTDQAAAVAAMAGATSTTPPKAKLTPAARVAAAKARLPLTPHQMAQSLVAKYGWSAAEFSCLDKLWTRESNWDPHEANGGSGAYGIPQSLPGDKMAAFGKDWRDNPMTQIKWGLWYIANRYSTPCAAWEHSQRYNYY